MENLNGNASGVNSLHPGELYDIELSKKDSSLGLSVTVLFGKVFTLFFVLHLFFPPPDSSSSHVVWFGFISYCRVLDVLVVILTLMHVNFIFLIKKDLKERNVTVSLTVGTLNDVSNHCSN